MKKLAQFAAVASVGMLLVGGHLLMAKDPSVPNNGQPEQTAMHVLRASQVIGMTVKNRANETVGTIDDLVLNAPNGKVRYAAVAVGGFLGIGERLFAVPWASMTFTPDGHSSYFLLDVDKEKMKNAPASFEKNNWPDVADPRFGVEIDRYFGVTNDRDRAEHPVAPEQR